MYKSDYEEREAIQNNHILKEDKKRTVDEEVTDDFIIQGNITTKIMNLICSKAVDYNKLPVDMGYKCNNLTEQEFREYATKLMRYIKAHDPIEYDSAHDRDQRFYHLRDVNRILIDDSYRVPAPVYGQRYHKPYDFRDTATYLRNTEDLLRCAMLTIEDLSQRILTARECAENDRELVEVILKNM